MSSESGRRDLIESFLDAFADNALGNLRSLLADGFVGHITTADGGSRRVNADEYAASVAAMDVPTANLRLSMPDVTTIGEDMILVMVEVHAERNGRTLHNHSGQLIRVRDGLICELWMVDALPEESDAFWSA